jgi:hypothetical protein
MIKFITNTLKLILYLLRILTRENFVNYIKKAGANNIHPSKKLVLLASGPSLSETLKNWKTNEIIKNADVLAVNYFCLDGTFIDISPKYYVLSDPVFFNNNPPVQLKEKINSLYDIFNNKVSWSMFLYIQYYAWKKTNWNVKIPNKNITVIPFHSVTYKGNEFLRNWFFIHGLGNGNYGTVILNGEYIGLTLGYKELYLYGVDHNFFDNLCVNENNQLCSINKHFYDNKQELKPLNHFWYGYESFYTVSGYLKDIASVFEGHEIMQKYAEYCSAVIYNCTKNSLIDAYRRFDDS